MELLLPSKDPSARAASFWRNPRAWLRKKNLGHEYWVFFSAAFFYDAGFAIYFFLFNLYLLDHRFNERAMGWIGGAMTLGSLVGTLPAGALAQRIGLRPLLIALFVSAPLMNAMRAVWLWEPAQIGLAFLQYQQDTEGRLNEHIAKFRMLVSESNLDKSSPVIIDFF